MRNRYEKLYRPYRKYCVLNNGDGVELDPDINLLVLELPKPPKEIESIKNYGMHPDNQIYRRDIMPNKLIALEEEVLLELQDRHEKNKNDIINGFKIVDLFWKKLSENSHELIPEIQFIKMVQWKRVYGEWIYIDGQPMWIPPWHYSLLNWWVMDGVKGNDGLPEFRIRDWKSYVHKHYLYTTHETFAKLDKKGIALKEEDGTYKMKDMGRRVFYGDIQPKNRRSGATHQGIEICDEISVHNKDSHVTMISKSVSDVENHFTEKLITAWQKKPVFMKPIWDGNNEPSVRIEYKSPSNVFGQDSLRSSFFVTKSTSEAVVDSMRLDCILMDEQGKETGGGRVDVGSRWRITKQTLSTGSGTNIHGFAINPSTAEEMDDGAKHYYNMCQDSNFYHRNEVGQTKSGLSLTYFPAQYCLEGFVDKFGKAVVNNPTERQIALNPNSLFANHELGSRQYLLSQRDAYLNVKTPTADKVYREEIRKQPMRYAESWMGGGGELGFPMEAIDRRIAISRRDGASWISRGYFFREGDKDSKVYWRDDEDGKFELSYVMQHEMTNLQTRKMIYDVNEGMMTWHKAPQSPIIIVGADPFTFESRQKSKLREGNVAKSDGGIGGFYPFDPKIDNGKDVDKWQSDRVVLTYRDRPESQDEYHEDLLMACVYLNAMCYPENNVKDSIKYFIARGYGGYLKYDVDPLTGKPVGLAGYHVGDGTKREMFNAVNDYLVRNTHRERHMSFLEECKKIRHTDELNHYDLLAAVGAALKGAEGMALSIKRQDHQVNIMEAYKKLGI